MVNTEDQDKKREWLIDQHRQHPDGVLNWSDFERRYKNEPVPYPEMSIGLAMKYLIDNGYIDEVSNGIMSFTRLTDKGIRFTSFAAERTLQEKKERDAAREAWPKRNWHIVMAIGYVLGVLSPITLDKIREKTKPISTQLQPLSPNVIDSSAHVHSYKK